MRDQKHLNNLKNEISCLVEHLRKDVLEVEDSRAKAQFEVRAEVLLGLRKSFDDYENKNEPAWKYNPAEIGPSVFSLVSFPMNSYLRSCLKFFYSFHCK